MENVIERFVMVKPEAFKQVELLNTGKFEIGCSYPVFDVSNGRVIIYNTDNGEMVEIFSKFLLFAGYRCSEATENQG